MPKAKKMVSKSKWIKSEKKAWALIALYIGIIKHDAKAENITPH